MSLKDTSSCSWNYILMHAVQRSESLNSDRGYCSYKIPLSLAAEVGKYMLSRIWDKRIRTDGTVIKAVEYSSCCTAAHLIQTFCKCCHLSVCFPGAQHDIQYHFILELKHRVEMQLSLHSHVEIIDWKMFYSLKTV